MIRKYLDPMSWKFRHYIGLALILSLFNLFGPKSFVHLFYLKKEAEELHKRKETLSENLSELQSQIQHFESSEFEQQRAIRKHLGYLKENELSLEFNDGN